MTEAELVEKVARDIRDTVERFHDGKPESPILELDRIIAKSIIPIVQEAERERCAGIVRDSKMFCKDELKLKHQLAAAIRSNKQG